MRRVRVIPVIMIDQGRAVITQRFSNPIYVGDPINSIKIFNDKEVDELIILDITNKKLQTEPNLKLIEKMASESFMPLAYGGHVSKLSQAEQLINCGIEKISFNTALFTDPDLVSKLSYRNGRQSIIASLDIKKNWLGRYNVKTKGGTQSMGSDVDVIVANVLELGVGEILVNCIDRDGLRVGYDIPLISRIASRCKVPVIACGGASTIADFKSAIIQGGASAVAAGAMFFFKGGFNAVLVNYPDQDTLTSNLYSHLEDH